MLVKGGILEMGRLMGLSLSLSLSLSLLMLFFITSFYLLVMRIDYFNLSFPSLNLYIFIYFSIAL